MEYKRCTKTIMDTTDPNISFNEKGESNYFTNFKKVTLKSWDPNGNLNAFENLIEKIKKDGFKKKYNCAIGISGGLDSSYLVYIAWKYKLRPLLIHTDSGWNSERAVQNIKLLLDTTGFDLITHVVDWSEMKDLQRSFFKASVPNQDIPQDQAIYAALYKTVTDKRIKWVLNGSNFATESILPTAWAYNAGDIYHIKKIHSLFGENKLKNYPMMGYSNFAVRMIFSKYFKIAKPLNLLKYEIKSSKKILEDNFGWEDHGYKHYESRFTKFYQGWYLPKVFGYDKRLAHLSSLILSNQMTRDEALKDLENSSLSEEEIFEEKRFVSKKLGFTDNEFEDILNLPKKDHLDYPNRAGMLANLIKIRDLLKLKK